MNFLTIEVSDPQVSGGAITLCGGSLDGELFSSGSAVFVRGDNVTFQKKYKKNLPSLHPVEPLPTEEVNQNSAVTLSNDIFVHGFWVLHRTIVRGFPAVICSYFNKRTQSIEQRYQKIFYKPGRYCCGPRFHKKSFYPSTKTSS
jgi:hypothetical protein